MTDKVKWIDIEKKAPDLAKCLQEVQRVFGKPEAVKNVILKKMVGENEC